MEVLIRMHPKNLNIFEQILQDMEKVGALVRIRLNPLDPLDQDLDQKIEEKTSTDLILTIQTSPKQIQTILVNLFRGIFLKRMSGPEIHNFNGIFMKLEKNNLLMSIKLIESKFKIVDF